MNEPTVLKKLCNFFFFGMVNEWIYEWMNEWTNKWINNPIFERIMNSWWKSSWFCKPNICVINRPTNRLSNWPRDMIYNRDARTHQKIGVICHIYLLTCVKGTFNSCIFSVIAIVAVPSTVWTIKNIFLVSTTTQIIHKYPSLSLAEEGSLSG